MKKVILIFLILISLNCEQRKKIPNELKIAFDYFDKNWRKVAIENLKNIKEEIPIPRNFDYGISAEIKNNILQNHPKSEILTKFFDSLDVQQYDDMAGILLISYQKYLNRQSINLNQLVKTSKTYWKPILYCEEQERVVRLEIYHNSKIGDTISIKMPVGNYNNVVDYQCPELDWEYNALKDLSIDGLITNKYIGRDSTDMILTVKVFTKNHPKTEILMEEVFIGDDFDISLNETAWKIKTTGNKTYK